MKNMTVTITREQIENFISLKEIAIVGVSRDKKKFGYYLIEILEKQSYTIYPVNINTDIIFEKKCYRTISDLPKTVEGIVIITPKHLSSSVLKEAITNNIKNIWIMQGCENEEVISIAKENSNLNIIMKFCILLYAKPKGVHKFHYNILKLFGKLPK